MKRFRALARQSPAIVISLIALTFSLGSGAGYAASVAAHHPAATKITWHGLGLRNGWKAAAKGFGTGKPAYTVSNGVVYLTGAASRINRPLFRRSSACCPEARGRVTNCGSRHTTTARPARLRSASTQTGTYRSGAKALLASRLVT
jgi:hypothetical protein